MKARVIDCGTGNIASVVQAFGRASLHCDVARNATDARDADLLVLAGVGHFGAVVNELSRTHLGDAIREHVRSGRPLLGICVGLQVLYDSSEESPGIPGLGLLPGHVRRAPVGSRIGWARLRSTGTSTSQQSWQGVLGGEYVFFNNNFEAVPTDRGSVVCVTDDDAETAAIVQVDNLVGTQFHPERSQVVGARFILEFANSVVSAC